MRPVAEAEAVGHRREAVEHRREALGHRREAVVSHRIGGTLQKECTIPTVPTTAALLVRRSFRFFKVSEQGALGGNSSLKLGKVMVQTRPTCAPSRTPGTNGFDGTCS